MYEVCIDSHTPLHLGLGGYLSYRNTFDTFYTYVGTNDIYMIVRNNEYEVYNDTIH